jgi:hypothetical protein
MSRRIGLRAATVPPVLAALAVVAVLAGPVTEVPTASAQVQNRAAVVVDTGSGSAAVCVRFSEPTITGLDALQRAGLGAVVRSFSGQGGAVCGLNGVGCPADDSCLTCQAPNYWAYHRAGPGAGGFAFSSTGAGSTQVTDGSVEGWRWGTGAAPAFRTVDQVCGAPPAPAPSPGTPDPATPAPPGATGGADPAAGPAADPSVPAATTGPITTTTLGGTSTTVGESGAEAKEGAGGPRDDVDGELAASSGAEPDGGGSPWAVVAFGALVAGIGGAAVVIRRRRSL